MLIAKLKTNLALFRYCTGVPRPIFDTMLEMALPFMTAPRRGHPWSEAHPPFLRLLLSLIYLRSNHSMLWLEIVTEVNDSSISRFLKEARHVWKLIGFEPPEPDPDWKIPPIVCVDSFIVPIPRPGGWDAQKPFFSKKHHQHALKVQIVTVNRNVACLSPPEVASVSDSSLLERNPIPAAFNKGNVYGDKAYPRDKIVRPRKKGEAGYIRHVSSWISKIRVDVEHEIKDLKDFKALRGYRLRDPLESLGGVLCLVANAVRLAA